VNTYRVEINGGEDAMIKAEYVEVTEAGALLFYSKGDKGEQKSLVIFAPKTWVEVEQQ
jgi:hypothetical protein